MRRAHGAALRRFLAHGRYVQQVNIFAAAPAEQTDEDAESLALAIRLQQVPWPCRADIPIVRSKQPTLLSSQSTD